MNFILIKIYDTTNSENNKLIKEISFDIFTKKIIINHIEKDNTVLVKLDEKGVVFSLSYNNIEYSYRQENKANIENFIN